MWVSPSIINRLVGKKRLTIGHKAGITRQIKWIRIHPQVDLMDSPGIIPPRLASDETGALLACVSSVGDAAFDDIEVANFLLLRLEALYPKVIQQHYGFDLEDDKHSFSSCGRGTETLAKGWRSRHSALGSTAPERLSSRKSGATLLRTLG